MVIVYILFLISFFLLFIFQSRQREPGSDHYVHLSFINQIRKNNHKITLELDNWIANKNFSYPHLLHIGFSYFSNEVLQRYGKYVNGLFYVLSLLLLMFFVEHLGSFGVFENESTKYYIFGLYIFTPFHYAIWNAKVKGISARAFGVLIGQLFLYLVVFYYLNNDYWLILLLGAVFYLSLLSSQFCSQFIFLSSLTLSFILKLYFILLVPLIGALLLFGCHFAWAKQFFVGQYWHKRLYSKYLAKVFILRRRYSIWRDFVYDFYLKLWENPKSGIFYVVYNPLFFLISGIPYLSWILWIYLFESNLELDPIILIQVLLVISCLTLFLATSIRPTRFLGEPERYVEFVIPFAIICFTHLLQDNSLILSGVLIFSFVFTTIQILVPYYWKSLRGHNKKVMNSLDMIRGSLLGKNYRIASNNTNVMRFLCHTDHNILIPGLKAPYTGSMHFMDFFPNQYFHIEMSIIPRILNEFAIDVFVYDKELGFKDGFKNQDRVQDLYKIVEDESFAVYKTKN